MSHFVFRLSGSVLLSAVALWSVGCKPASNSRRAEERERTEHVRPAPPPDKTDSSAARAIGRGAYKASQEAGKIAKKAGKEIGKGIKEASEGWKDARREAKTKKK